MFSKLNNLLKNNWKIYLQNISIFILIFFIIAPVFLEKSISNLDELWNYNFASNIANGLVPYRDFNMLQTPLLPFVAGFILHFFGNELMIMRILGVFCITILFNLIYHIFKLLKVHFSFNILFFFLFFILLKNNLCIDYNFSVLIFTLLIIYLEIKYYFKNKNILTYHFVENLFIGLLAGCSILLKQSTGLFISIIAVGYKIFIIKNKNDFKLFCKIFFSRILGILIPILFLIIYLLINHAFYDFIDYTVLGIKTFTNSISYINLIHSSNMIIKILSIFIPIFLIGSCIYVLKKKEIISIILFFYALGSLIVIYPIADNIHFLIGIIPSLLLLFYFIFYILKKLYCNIKNNKIIIFVKELFKINILLLFIVFFLYRSIITVNYINDNKNILSFEHFNYIPMSEEQYRRIHLIDSYILSQNTSVYILDADAVLYMIPINKYYKDFNLFLKGNLGSNGEEGQIEKIKNLASGSQILIKNENYYHNWQTPEKVISYIKNNLNKVGEISLFDIYEK